MGIKAWEPIKVKYCEHVLREVALEAEAIYPADYLPDQPPRIIGHRCSLGIYCSQDNRAACRWAGTNPAYDPFVG